MGFSIRRYLLAKLSRREAGVEQLDWKRLRFSYAQHGEDIVAETLLPQPLGFYVEAGAYHPVQISNTYLFYRKGWRGIEIDPAPRVASLFRRRRPRDIFVEAAVCHHEGEALFDLMDANECNHLHGSSAPLQARQPAAKSIKVRCRRLDSILDELLPPGQTIDFLSVDCEGHDLNALRSNNWTKYRPRVVAVEDWEPENQSEICQYLLEQRYRSILSTKITRFFVPVDQG